MYAKENKSLKACRRISSNLANGENCKKPGKLGNTKTPKNRRTRPRSLRLCHDGRDRKPATLSFKIRREKA
jgi:hypothetical protein